MNKQNKFMQMALTQAQMAYNQDEIPIGAVIVQNEQVLAVSFNTCEQDQNPLQHAELKAIMVATTAKKNWRLNDCEMYVTLEPCPMCLGALFQARLGYLYYGCDDHKRVAHKSTQSFFPSLKGKAELKDNNHTLQIMGGIMATESSALLKDFFAKRRQA